MSLPRDQFPRLFQAQYAAFDEDLPLWRSLAAEHPGAVLELGCGPGRVLLDLAEAGHAVVGVDRDAAMLAQAQRQLAPHLASGRARLVQADLRDFDLDETFPLALVTCNTFAHLTDEEASSSLTNIHKHLRPGGALALDLPAPSPSPLNEDEEAEPLAALMDPESGKPVQIYAAERKLEGGDRMEVVWRYDELQPDGKVLRLEIPVVYHLRSQQAMKQLFTRAGYSWVEFFGDYERGRLQASSARMIAVAAAA